MQLNQLKSNSTFKARKRVARGGVHGVFSGRGAKGQISRAGRNVQPIIRQFVKRYPKMRGYRQNLLEQKPVVLELVDVVRSFDVKEIISPSTLAQKNIVPLNKGKYPRVKILGTAKLDKAFKFSGLMVSQSARKSIEEAGGKVIMVKSTFNPGKKPNKVKKVKTKIEGQATEAKTEKKAPAKKAAKK